MNKNRIIRLSWQKRTHALSLSYTQCSTRHPMSPDLREERKTLLKGIAEETNTVPPPTPTAFPSQIQPRLPPREDREAAAGWGPAEQAASLESGDSTMRGTCFWRGREPGAVG